MAKHSKKEKKERERPVALKILLGILSVIGNSILIVLKIAGTVLLVGTIAGLIFLTYFSTYLKDNIIPEAEDFAENLQLDSISLDQTSFIFYYDKATDSYQKMQQIDTVENRVWVSYQEIPKNLVHSAVAIEDKRFFEHEGVDWITTGKACLRMFLGSGSAGGSTLTQQLIKNLTGENEVTVHRKLQEIFRALELEKRYSKEEIMEWYMNTIFLGEGCYGVQSAARAYFGKDVGELTAAECASMISITNNPSLFDPYISEKRNRERQLIILSEMKEQGYLNEQEYQQAKAQELDFHSNFGDEETYACPNGDFEGIRDDFVKNEEDGRWYCPLCGAVTGIVDEQDYYSYYTDTIIRDVINDMMDEYGYTEQVASKKLSTGGYIIYAAIDMDIQKQVDAIYEDVSNVPATTSDKQMQSAIVVVDNVSGDIVAMAGGVGKKEGSLTLNRATQSRRQPGSSIKPLAVYAPALDAGVITPGTIYEDSPYENNWPKNDDWTYRGNVTVTRGVVSSLNTISVKVLADLGVDKAFEYAKERFGLSTLVESTTVNGKEFTDKALAPLSMGALTYGVTVRDMAQAYASFPNKGVFREARTYTKVEDSNGKVILDNTQSTHTVISEKAAWYMTSILQNAVQTGTGYYARLDNMAVAGKTGTSSDNKDRWFSGFTPYYTASVWCGFDEPEEIVLSGSWANPAAVLWQKVMTKLHAGMEYAGFPSMDGATSVTLCVDSGMVAGEACKDVVSEDEKLAGDRTSKVILLGEDIEEHDTCDRHEMVKICSESGKVATEYCEKFEVKVEEKGMLVKDEDGKPIELETCDLHTEKTWKEHEEAQQPTEPEPTEPTDVTGPTDPTSEITEPTEPTDPTSETSNGASRGIPDPESTGLIPTVDRWDETPDGARKKNRSGMYVAIR